MSGLLLKWLSNTVALFAVVHLAPGVSVERWQALFLGALAIGLLNAVLKPVLILFTLPVNILTLGLFTLVINGVLFHLAAWLVQGFHVSGFGSAFIAAFLFSIITFFLNLIIKR